MKRFAFKLEAVLTLRQRTEQAALEKYSRAIQHRQACAGRVAEAEMELSETRRQWLNLLADGCPAARAAQMLSFCHQLEERKRQRERYDRQLRDEERKLIDDLVNRRSPISLAGKPSAESLWN
jgi:flagellar biosynthesis chaperone FliJ